AGLNVGVGHVGAELLRNFEDGINVFLLGVENKNANRDQQCVDGESGNSSRPSESPSESGRKDGSAFTTVKIDSQGSGQHDSEKWNDPDENAEHARLERGTDGDSPVHRSGLASGNRAQAGECTGLRDLRRSLVRRGIQACRRSGIWNRNLHMNLGSAALRAKRPAVFDRGPTLLARVLHVFETSAQRTGRARREIIDSLNDLAIESLDLFLHSAMTQ